MSNAGNFYEVIAQSYHTGAATGPAPTPRVTMDVLKNHAAFTEPLSTIENMWRVKYGTEWVSEKDVYYGGDEFYVLAMHRLSQSSRLERFMLSDTYDYVVRLPE